MTTQAKTAGNSQCAIAAQSAQHTPTPNCVQASHNRMVCTLRDFIEGQESAVRKGANVSEVLALRCKMSVERAKDDLKRALPLCGTDPDPSFTLAKAVAELAAVKAERDAAQARCHLLEGACERKNALGAKAGEALEAMSAQNSELVAALRAATKVLLRVESDCNGDEVPASVL